MTGKLIVIDGPDSVGKSTQTKLLAQRLQKLGFKVLVTDFPRYGEPSAWLVEQYLRGKFGSAKKVGPFVPAIFFAVDRYDAAGEMRQALRQGKILISNRYVTASMAHQGLKITNRKHRQEFYKWVQELEYNTFGLPKPDFHLFLHMPYKVSQILMRSRKGKKKDIHEKNVEHLRKAELTYLEIAAKFKYTIVRSVLNGKLQKPEEINERIWQILKSKLKV